MKKIAKSVQQAYNYMKKLCIILKFIYNSSKFTSIMLILVNVIQGAIVPINMMIYKYFIDSVVSAIGLKNPFEGLRDVSIWLMIQFLLAIFARFLSGLNRYLYDNLVKLYDIYVSKLLLRKMDELDISFFENSKFNDKIEKANKESAMRSMNILEKIIEIIQTFTCLSGSIAIIFSIHYIIPLIYILTIAPIFIVNIKIYDKIYGTYNERVQEIRFINHLQRLLFNYSSVKEIKLNRIGNYFENIIISTKKKHLEQDRAIGKKQMKNLLLVDLINNIASFGFKLYVVFVTVTKSLTLGTMTMYISALSNIETSIKGIINAISYLYADNLYLESLFEVLKTQPKIVKTENQIEFQGEVINSIRFDNVSFKYPSSEKYVLKNINLELKANQVYAIVGLNGSGKTTLVKLLTRLYDPTEGNIYIDGKNIKEFDIKTLHENISVVFQDFMRYPFTVRENIGFGNVDNVDNIEMIKQAAKKTEAEKFIEELPKGYDTKLEKLWDDGVELSLGQWQKIAISRAFVNEGSILILDEPTASLDAQAEYELFQNFKELINNTTCIIISHRFSTVRMADKIIVIEDGSICEFGNHNELMKQNGIYAEFFNMQAEAYVS